MDPHLYFVHNRRIPFAHVGLAVTLVTVLPSRPRPQQRTGVFFQIEESSGGLPLWLPPVFRPCMRVSVQ